ncbi:zinc finger protein 862 [Chrysochromulina tobinii]|uniref:Zinc finger protein 862 n=2 Tax=Chrysochromulina tobinii TaxID=1460289 RepID=A0A0M0K395_9EUKA|nr:zinc finger protein 862 [Chrysochromulina tobinii]|eukprot:KOO33057.1 zinc finger protein 862 [Chrysochromulina sp. CCMP291]
MQSVFPRGLPFGFLGDGSNDRSLVEQEAVVTRHLGADGKPYNSFFDLAPLDLTTSYDQRSPDALCMLACYSKSFDQLNQYQGFLHLSDWKKALIGGSFDGATVMLGSQGGTAKLLKDKVETHLTILHAAAHVEQLALGDAFKEVTYYDEWGGIVQEVYVYYNASGKKRFGLEAVANELKDKLLKIKGTHGIRWAASQAATLTALLADLPSVVVDLEQTAKATVGCQYTLLTPSNSFLGKSFKQRFEAEDGGRPRDWKATVKSVKVSDDGVAANDVFVLSYSNKTTMEISKAQLVAFLTDEDASGLVDEYTWQLRSRLINFRFAAFTAFMLDVHNQLGILSKGFQSNTLVIFDISKNLNRTLRSLEKLKKEESCGPEESKFWGFVNTDDADCLRTCQLEEGESGRKALKTDRIEVIDALSSHLVERFQKVLDDPILEAFSIFDVRKWPEDKDVLKDSYIDGIKLLYKTYKIFYAEEETEEMVLEQWEDLKAEINVPTLRTLSFHQLWANMLVQYADEYALVLRLVVISLLIPADTSECERIFSLMNDLKTAERSSMGQQNLKNLMLWHIMGYKTDAEGKKVKMPCCDVPVMAILKEFRSMAFENGGMLGRKAHRAAAVPKYEYEKHRAPVKAATSAASSAADE